MNIGAIVTIVSGLAGVYVILALITSHFSEGVAALVGKRGSTLYAGLVRLLGDVTTVDASGAHVRQNLADLVYAHPLVNGLGTSNRKPSYVPTRNLSLALVSVMSGLSNPAATSSALAAPADLLQDLIANVDALQGRTGVAKGLVSILQTAKTDYNGALKAIDAWFNAQMDRISGAYKRWSFVVQLVIALAIVVALNADTFAIIQQLSKDATLSTALASAGSIGAAGSTDSAARSVGKQLATLSNDGLQLGWPAFGGAPDGWGVLRKCSGLLVTWAAALLGAPFWFDLLKQLAPLRLSGSKPADPKDTAADAQSR